MRILIDVDITNAFCAKGGLPVPDGDSVVPVANALMREGQFDYVIAVNDRHPANHKCFARNHPGHDVFSTIDLNGLTQVLWPDHAIENTEQADFHPDLDTSLIDFIVYKGTDPEVDSNSGFFDNARRNETERRSRIEKLAEDAGVPLWEVELTIVGLATDWCVKMTALDACELGFDTTVVIDACRAVNLVSGDEEKAIREMIAAGIHVVESREILPARDRFVARPRQQELHP